MLSRGDTPVWPWSFSSLFGTVPSRYSVCAGISNWKCLSATGRGILRVSSLMNRGRSVPEELKRSIIKQAHITRRRISRSIKLNLIFLFRIWGSYSKSLCKWRAKAIRMACPPRAQARPPWHVPNSCIPNIRRQVNIVMLGQSYRLVQISLA